MNTAICRGALRARFVVCALSVLALGSIGEPALGQRARRSTNPPATLPSFTVQPVMRPSENAPLAASITFETDIPARGFLLVRDGSRTLVIRSAPQYTQEHEMLVLGVFPDTTNLIRVFAMTPDQEWVASNRTLVFETSPLPADFPPIRVVRIDPARTEPGYTLIGPKWTNTSGPPGGQVTTVILDELGRVVWYKPGIRPRARLRNGNLLGTVGKTLQEIDMLGNVLHQWYVSGRDGGAGAPPGAILIDTDRNHHETREMPAGADADFLFLSSELRTYADYPLSEEYPDQTVASADVVGDVIVEVRRDGTIVREKSLLDILDPRRVCWGNTDGLRDYPPGARDWSHSNSIYLDESDDTYIVSVRHQDTVVKFQRSTPGTGSPDDIVWILGAHQRWNEPWSSKLLRRRGSHIRHEDGISSELFGWQYHQHAAVLNGRGNLVLYDNGNYRAIPPAAGEPTENWYSRAVEYRIDPVRMTVSQAWSVGGRYDPEPFRLDYSFAQSSAFPLPLTDNVLVCSARRRDLASDTFYAQILELERSVQAETVLEIIIREPGDTRNWSCGRATRIPVLNPY
jgi:arylsulfate sulfotransferase